MIPELFRLGPLPIHSFGLMMVLAFLAASQRYALCLESGGARAELAEKLVFWVAVGGLLGARVLFLFTFPDEFFQDPLGSIFSGSGFVFYGGFLGGILGFWMVTRKEGESFLRYGDLAGPALAIGYAVGRIGCQLSGDGDYGIASTLPWAIGYPLGVVPTDAGVLVHPTPIYETFAALFIAFLLLRFRARGLLQLPGQAFGMYLVLTAVERFFVEFVRIEPKYALGFSQAQWMAIVLLVVGAGLILRKRQKGEDE